ncbi:MAG: virulence RhuM family protein [Propionibacteriaceae bacterium]|nr:virulence RhuM family protein [Propionibacteriaceae bacterium]
MARADADREHMGLTTWKHAPSGKIDRFLELTEDQAG